MNKHRTLKAVGFFVVLAVVVAFLALPNSEAAKGKPIRWKAAILPVVDGNLSGQTADFIGGENGVDITNGTRLCADGINSYSFLQMRVYDPSSLNFYMDKTSFITSNYDHAPDAPAPCGFNTVDCSWPNCVAEFLNGRDQPTPEYGWVCVRFTTYRCDNYNLMTMKVSDPPVPVHMSIEFWSHAFDCPKNSPWASNPLHNLIMNAHGYTKINTSLPDIYIQKISDKDLVNKDVWTASVNTIFDNSDLNKYGESYKDFVPTSSEWAYSDNILGQFATCSGKGKNTVMKYWYPWAKAPLKFQINFTIL